ncbi:hypothetical protein IE53DRAFT_344641 [Violaceomyces palustris]|uniref:Uncharacterized protein n=1 Tax=Violaceomyces palustris TaxID=1673888 RepID=A0ACD0NWG8_9BASI|nr:hypothetical protein IE53DRAFT_344641 [Violaceomyces palustris]
MESPPESDPDLDGSPDDDDEDQPNQVSSSAPPTPPDPIIRAHQAEMERLRALVDSNSKTDRELMSLWPRLKNLKASLDQGKEIRNLPVGRGLPLSVLVKILKSCWHNDGTWPLDESVKDRTSIDPTRLPQPEPGPPARPDPDPQQVAEAYKSRGIFVEDPVPLDHDKVW